MGKIYRMNAGGTIGVSLSKQMKAAGYEVGKEVAWVWGKEGFILKLVQSKATTETAKTEGAETPPAV
jgi:hypothetical protein